MDWLSRTFSEFSLAWLLISSVVGGLIGASGRLVFDVLLPRRLQERAGVIAAKRKYATPILLAADDLRHRLENMIVHIDDIEEEKWLSDDKPPQYYLLSTLFIVGQFFGWLHILRRTVVYLDFTTTRETRNFKRFLDDIEWAFSTPGLMQATNRAAAAPKSDRWVFSWVLRAIGETMVTREDGEYRTLGYASFRHRFTDPADPEFREWFHSVGRVFIGLRRSDVRFQRIVVIHALLNAYVEYADNAHLRTTPQRPHWDLLPDESAARIRQRLTATEPALSNPSGKARDVIASVRA